MRQVTLRSLMSQKYGPALVELEELTLVVWPNSVLNVPQIFQGRLCIIDIVHKSRRRSPTAYPAIFAAEYVQPQEVASQPLLT